MEEKDFFGFLKFHMLLKKYTMYIDRQLEGLLDQFSLSPMQVFLLSYVEKRKEGTSITEIHHAVNYSKGTISENIKKLRNEGYVMIEYCTDDERRKKIYLTDKGQELIHYIDTSCKQTGNQLFGVLSEEEKDQYFLLNEKIVQSMEQKKGVLE